MEAAAGAVEAAAGAVEAALRGAGFEAERQDQSAGLTDIFPGTGEGLAEWIVIAPAGSRWCCNWSTSTGAASRWQWISARSFTWKTSSAGKCAR